VSRLQRQDYIDTYIIHIIYILYYIYIITIILILMLLFYLLLLLFNNVPYIYLGKLACANSYRIMYYYILYIV